MSRSRTRPFAALILAAATALGLAVTPPATAAAAANLVLNPGFEAGNTAGWSCPASAAVVTSPARTGAHALSATPAGSDLARCEQTISVRPNSSYALSAWVQGSYVYLGATGTGIGDKSTWTSAATSWTQLSTSFTTGASTTSVKIYTHGWYGQSAYYVDDVVLDGPPGGGQPQLPAAPSGLNSTGTTSSSVSLAWSAVTGASGYHVYRNGTKVGSSPEPSYVDSGLTPATGYDYTVTAYNGVGESARSNQVRATTAPDTGTPGPLPKHALTGYWQNFVNGAAPLRIRDVNNHYDLIAIAFADADTTRPGAVAFTVDSGLSSALGGYTDANMIADIAAKRAQGKKFVFSVGGERGNVDLSTGQHVANFVDSMYALLTKFGVDGVDVDLEHGINAANTASAMRQLRQKLGAGFLLTMAPQTLDVQPSGRYMPLIQATKDILTVVHTQYYNSGTMNGCDGQVYSQGSVDFITAQACLLLQTLRPDQVALGLPASSRGAGSGYVDPSVVNNAVSCLAKATNCGKYKPTTPFPALRGVMTWSINWDQSNGNRFANTVRPHLATLP